MDSLGKDMQFALLWWTRRRNAMAVTLLLVIYWYLARKRACRLVKINNRTSFEIREKRRNEVMKDVMGPMGRAVIGMTPPAFMKLCEFLQQEGGLKPTRRASIEEQVAKTLHILTRHARSREVGFWFKRSGETTHRHFYSVLKSILKVEENFIKQPDGSSTPLEIQQSNRFYPYFKDCVGAIDGTHIRAKVPAKLAVRYRGRKEYTTMNVLCACSFDLKLTYVLSGWEGTASDSRILKDAISREHCLEVPEGKYYIADAGFGLKSEFITPYRGVRYHLKEFTNNRPRTARELFNLRHASLRNAVERTFGVLKKRFQIISSANEPTMEEDTFSGTTESVTQKGGQLFTDEMDEALLDALILQQQKGLKQNGTFVTHAYINVVQIMQEKFGSIITKDRVQNRYKKLKTAFAKCYDFWRDGMSGFAWNPVTKLWSAEPKVWAALIKERPAAKDWMTKPVPHYNKLLVLYRNERATGDDSLTAREAVRRGFGSIEEIDELVSQEEVHIESFDCSNVEAPGMSSSNRAQKNRKAKSVKTGDGDDCIVKAVQSMVQVMEEGNRVFQNVLQRHPITAEQVWSLLEETGLENNLVPDAHYQLISNPDKLQAVLGCPAQRRKDYMKQILGLSRYGP